MAYIYPPFPSSDHTHAAIRAKNPIPPPPKENPDMTTLNASSLEEQIRTATAALTRLRKYGEDDYPEGTVLAWDHVPPERDEVCRHYVAVKTTASWSIAPVAGSARIALTWEQLIHFITRGGTESPDLWRVETYAIVKP